VAAAVAAAVLYLTDNFGLELDGAAIEIAALGIVTGVYNWLVNKAAEAWPYFGYLLGIPKTPTYTSTPTMTP